MEQDFSDVQVTGEIVKRARQNVDQNIWDYLMGGGETETTLLRNRQALDVLAFRPRVLNDVREISLERTVFGAEQRIPVLLAPIGSLQHFDPRGAVASSQAAAKFGVSAYISSVTEPSIEEIREQTDGNLIFQLYVRGDEDWVFERFDTAVNLGYHAICLTVDTAAYGRRERDLSKNYQPRGGPPSQEGREYQAALNWDTVKRVRERYDIPLIIKGIATAEDTEIAVGIGVHGIHVSNHGGRQLDFGLGTMDVLPEVVEAAGGKAEIIIDGGFMRGTDVLKAVALGADAVAVGKLYGLGLAAGGEAGVARVLEILEGEMLNAIALLGARSLDELGPEMITRTEPVREASVVSAYPLIEIDQYHY